MVGWTTQQPPGRIAESPSTWLDSSMMRERFTIDREEKRELLTLYAKDDSGTPHPAWMISDGTLRFLALVVLEMDPETQGLLCLEEPENGIHPARIAAILELLRDIAADTREPTIHCVR
jgi:predicted ATPase